METEGVFLTFFGKRSPAGAAGNGDLPLAAGDAQGLLAVGALEVAVLLIPGLGALQLQPAVGRSAQTEEFGVFGPAAVDLTAHHAEDGDKDAHQTQGGQPLHPGDDGRQPEHKVQDQQKIIQLIAAVAAVHQFLQKITNHKGTNSLLKIC